MYNLLPTWHISARRSLYDADRYRNEIRLGTRRFLRRLRNVTGNATISAAIHSRLRRMWRGPLAFIRTWLFTMELSRTPPAQPPSSSDEVYIVHSTTWSKQTLCSSYAVYGKLIKVFTEYLETKTFCSTTKLTTRDSIISSITQYLWWSVVVPLRWRRPSKESTIRITESSIGTAHPPQRAVPS